MNNSVKERLLHDYREDVIKRDRKKLRKKTVEELDSIYKDWNNSNDIIQKTMMYEVSFACSDVESYGFVKENAFDCYCKDYKKYKTADIMNGWWFCFKKVFKIETSRINCETVKIKKKIRDGKYNPKCIDIQLLCKLSEYLRIVYTLGNITPAPINPGGSGFGEIDLWEYKLNRFWEKDPDNIEKLYFHDYEAKSSIMSKSFSEYMESFDLIQYMDSRIDLILRRGYRILTSGEEISDKDLDLLRKIICTK